MTFILLPRLWKKYLSCSLSCALYHKTGRASSFGVAFRNTHTHIHVHAHKTEKIGGRRSERGQAQHLVGNLFYEIKRAHANLLSPLFHFTFTTCGPPFKRINFFFFLFFRYLYIIFVNFEQLHLLQQTSVFVSVLLIFLSINNIFSLML